MAHVRLPRPDSGPGFQFREKNSKCFLLVPFCSEAVLEWSDQERGGAGGGGIEHEPFSLKTLFRSKPLFAQNARKAFGVGPFSL